MPKRSLIRHRLDVYGKELSFPLAYQIGFDTRKDPSLRLETHQHDGFELTYVFEGSVVWELQDGTRLYLDGGDMALTQPGIDHRGYLNIVQPASLFWLVTDNFAAWSGIGTLAGKKEARAVFCALSSAGNQVWYAGERMERSLSILHRQLQEWRAAATPEKASLMLPGIRGLLIHVITTGAGIVSGGEQSRAIDSYVQTARSFMRQHLDEDFSMEDVGAKLGISLSRLHAVFKQQTGLTPNDYLQRIRIEKAQAQLVESEKSITEIALDTGFSTSQYFATCFKKYTGMSPGEFRGRGRIL